MGRIEKVRNYNQIILAIAGTIGILFLVVAAFLTLSEMSGYFFNQDNDSDRGILAVEQTDQLKRDSLRKQIVSFNRIQVIDSINQVYLLPVTQANLADAESTNQMLGLVDTKSIGRNYEKAQQGNIYNNLLLHNASDGQSKAIFTDRVSIENFIIHESNDQKFIVIPACSIDSNKDSYLNDRDLQELFIYDIQKDELKKIDAGENYTTLRAFQPEKSNRLIVHFGIDRNKNGAFESGKEPMIFYKVNLANLTLEEFVSKEEIDKLQALLQGN